MTWSNRLLSNASYDRTHGLMAGAIFFCQICNRGRFWGGGSQGQENVIQAVDVFWLD
jgi:hypothetical protein